MTAEIQIIEHRFRNVHLCGATIFTEIQTRGFHTLRAYFAGPEGGEALHHCPACDGLLNLATVRTEHEHERAEMRRELEGISASLNPITPGDETAEISVPITLLEIKL